MNSHKVFCGLNCLLISLLIIFNAQLSMAETSMNQPEQHGFQKSNVEAIYEGEGYRIIQFKFKNLSVYSYLVVSDNEALIVDPVRDVSPYLEYVEKNKLNWKGTLLTQTHFDFVAGHREMAFATGSPVYASSKSKNLFPFIALEDGQMLKVGSVSLEVLHTPGHTLDSICLVVYSKVGKKQFLISGDTISYQYSSSVAFSAFNLTPADMVEKLLNSWNEKLSVLPHSVIILPTHYHNLYCCQKSKYEPCSTIGKQKQNNPYFQLSHNKSLFMTKILSNLPKISEFNKKIGLINQRGPDLVNWQQPFKDKISSLIKFKNDKNFWLFDVRDFNLFANGHLKGTLNLSEKDKFEKWLPQVISLESKVVLYGPDDLVDQVARRLKLIGIYSYKLDENYQFNSKLTSLGYIKPEDFYAEYKEKKSPPVLNIALKSHKFEIDTNLVINKTISELGDFLKSTFNPGQEFVLLSSNEISLRLAAAVMEKAGFNNFHIFSGGTLAWVEAGLPIKDSSAKICSIHDAAVMNDLSFPVVLTVEEILKDYPNKLDKYSILDIRSKDQVEKYNPLQGNRVEIGSLLSAPENYGVGKPLLIVDSQGTAAFFVAALLAKKSNKKVFVLKGGLQAFWEENLKNEFKFNNPG